MKIFRNIDFVDIQRISKFLITESKSFTSNILFYFIQHQKEIEIGNDGILISNSGSGVFYPNETIHSNIISSYICPNMSKLFSISENFEGVLYYVNNFPPKEVEIGNDIVCGNFVNNESLVIVNQSHEVIEIHLNDLNNKTKLFKLRTQNDKIIFHSILKIGDFIFISTNVGIFLGENKICQNESFYCVHNNSMIYFLTTSGIIQFNLKTQELNKLFSINEIMKYTQEESTQFTKKPLCFINSTLIVCTRHTVLGLPLGNKIIGPIYFNNEPKELIGVTSFQEKLYAYTEENCIILSIPPFKPVLDTKVTNDEFIQILSNVLTSDKSADIAKKVEQFNELSNLLKSNSDFNYIIIPLLIDLYCQIPNSSSHNFSPLLLHILKNNRGIVSFDYFLSKLVEYDREDEIFDFIIGFDSINIESILAYAKPNLISENDVLFYLNQCDPSKINIASICDNFPGLSYFFQQKVGNSFSPFILNRLADIDKQKLESLRTYDGSIVDTRIAEKLNTKPSFSMNSSFYLLDSAKSRHDWNEALFLSEKLHIDEEIKNSKSKIDINSDMNSRLMKEMLDSSDKSEILMQLVDELEHDDSNKKFADYSVFAHSIGKKIDTENFIINGKKIEENKIMNELMLQRSEVRSEFLKISKDSICQICHKPLGKGKVSAFKCGHVFHLECKELLEKELISYEKRVRSTPMKLRGCPLCGPQSSLNVFHKMNKKSIKWSTEL